MQTREGYCWAYVLVRLYTPDKLWDGFGLAFIHVFCQLVQIHKSSPEFRSMPPYGLFSLCESLSNFGPVWLFMFLSSYLTISVIFWWAFSVFPLRESPSSLTANGNSCTKCGVYCSTMISWMPINMALLFGAMMVWPAEYIRVYLLIPQTILRSKLIVLSWLIFRADKLIELLWLPSESEDFAHALAVW